MSNAFDQWNCSIDILQLFNMHEYVCPDILEMHIAHNQRRLHHKSHANYFQNVFRDITDSVDSLFSFPALKASYVACILENF